MLNHLRRRFKTGQRDLQNRRKDLRRKLMVQEMEHRRVLATVTVGFADGDSREIFENARTNATLDFTLTRTADTTLDQSLTVQFNLNGELPNFATFREDYTVTSGPSEGVFVPQNAPPASELVFGTARFEPGETTTQVRIDPTSDILVEGVESLTLTVAGSETFGNVQGAAAQQTSQQTVFWAVDDQNRLATVDTEVGVVDVIDTITDAEPIADIAFNENGDLFAISLTSLFQIHMNPEQTSITAVRRIGTHGVADARALVHAQDGDFGTNDFDLLIAGSGSLDIFRMDLEEVNSSIGFANPSQPNQLVFNGQQVLQSMGIFDTYTTSGDMDYGANGDLLLTVFGPGEADTFDSVLRVKPATGTATLVRPSSPAQEFPRIFGVASSSNESFGFSDNRLLRIGFITSQVSELLELTGTPYTVGAANQATGSILDPTTVDVPSLEILADTADQEEGTGFTTPFGFKVFRDGNTNGSTVVSYEVILGPADLASESDFEFGVLPQGQLLFSALETEKDIFVNVVGDSFAELDESFTVRLTEATGGATFVNTTATGTIRNDDAARLPTVRVSPVSAVKDEGDTGTQTEFTFQVTRQGDASAPSTVNYTVLPSGIVPASADDFSAGLFPSGTISFVGEQTTPETISFLVEGDVTVENDETFSVVLSDPVGAEIEAGFGAAVGRIRNDDVISFPSLSVVAEQFDQPEGSTSFSEFRFNVLRQGSTDGTASVNYAVLGSNGEFTPATADDFFDGQFPNGTVTFSDGENIQTISVPVLGDTQREADEAFVVVLSQPQRSTINVGQAKAVIRNDDNEIILPRISISALNATQDEGNATETRYSFLVGRSGENLDLASSVNFSVVGNGSTQANPADFNGGVLPSGTVAFQPTELEKQINIDVLGDLLIEPDEGFSVVLSNPVEATIAAGTANAIIRNDDEGMLPSLTILERDAVKNEGDDGTTTFTFTVRSTVALPESASVNFTVRGDGLNPASASDFAGGVFPTGEVTIESGTSQQTIEIQVSGDTDNEQSEGFSVSLSDATGNVQLGDTVTVLGLIENDDAPVGPINMPPTIALVNVVGQLQEQTTTSSIRVADIQITDDGLGTNALTITGPDQALFEIVGTQLFVREGASFDVANNASLDAIISVDDNTIAPSPNDMAAISIGVTMDPVDPDPDPDPDPNPPAGPAANFLGGRIGANESVGSIEIFASLTETPSSTVTIPVTVSGGAVAGTDFTIADQAFTFDAGQRTGSLVVNLIDNQVVDGDRQLNISISDSASIAGADQDFAITIRDNDAPGDTRFVSPEFLDGPQLVPGDGKFTAYMFRALQDTDLTVYSVGRTSVRDDVRVLNRSLETIASGNSGVQVSLEADQLYALIFRPRDFDTIFSVMSSAGPDSIIAPGRTNLLQSTDVNADGESTSLDALMIINDLNQAANGESVASGVYYPDVNGDGRVSALDALIAINEQTQVALAEGESVVNDFVHKAAVATDEVLAAQQTEDFCPLDKLVSAETPSYTQPDPTDLIATANPPSTQDYSMAVDEFLSNEGLA